MASDLRWLTLVAYICACTKALSGVASHKGRLHEVGHDYAVHGEPRKAGPFGLVNAQLHNLGEFSSLSKPACRTASTEMTLNVGDYFLPGAHKRREAAPRNVQRMLTWNYGTAIY